MSKVDQYIDQYSQKVPSFKQAVQTEDRVY